MRGVRPAIRSLWRDRWSSACVLAVSSLAITLNVTVFAVADGVLFKPLPFHQPDELFLITRGPGMSVESPTGLVSERDIAALRRSMPTARIGFYAGGPGSIGMLRWAVSPNLLEVLGVSPALGGFRASALEWYSRFDATGLDHRSPVLISHSLWQRMFAGDTGVVGRAVTLAQVGDRAFGFSVVGVLPPDFVFPFPDGEFVPDLISPWTMDSGLAVPEGRGQFVVIARIPVDGSPRAAGVQLTDLANRIGRPGGLLVRPLSDVLGRAERAELAPVLAAAGGVLALSLLNIVSIVIARATLRQRDYAVRRALGAGRVALMRQVLLEVLPLTLIGAGIAVVATPYALAVTRQLLPHDMLLLKQPTIDGRVFVVAALITAVATALITIVVANAVERRSARSGVLHGPGPVDRGIVRGGRVLLASQVGIAAALVVLASTFGVALATAWSSDTGYESSHLAVVEAGAVSGADVSEFNAQADELVTLLSSVSGVEAVAGTEVDFVSGSTISLGSEYTPAGWGGSDDELRTFQVVANFFDVLGLELREGRWPSPEEWRGRAPVAVVSESAARAFWPGSSAVGQTLSSRRRSSATPPVTVIGVVNDARFRTLDQGTAAAVYVPRGLIDETPPFTFFVRTSDRAARVLPRLVEAVRADSRFRLERARTGSEALFTSVRPKALRAWLFGWFGLVSLVVVAVGIVALVVASTARRRREIAVRVAVGARPWPIVRMFVAEQAVPVVVGLAVGGFAGFLSLRAVQSAGGLSQSDSGLTWALAAALLISTVAASALVPAAWTSRVDPMQTLRAE